MYGLKVFLAWIPLTAIQANANIVLPESNHHNCKLVRFAIRAYQNYCLNCKTTAIIHDEEDAANYFLSEISSQDFTMSIISMKLDGTKLHGVFMGIVIELTIIFWTEKYYDNPDYFLDTVEKSCYWNRFSKMVIIATGIIPEDYVTWLESTFRKFWNRKILRVFLCFYANVYMQIYMFNPFLGEYSIDITNSTDKEYYDYLEYELIDLFGYPMKTYLYDVEPYDRRAIISKKDSRERFRFKGFDGKFMGAIRNTLNVSLELYRETNGSAFTNYVTLKNISLNKMIGKFIEFQDLDIWLTAVQAFVNGGVNYLFLHERNDLCVVAPTGKPIPQYYYIFLVIPVELWLGTIICFIIVTVTLKFFHRPSATLDMYRVLISVPIVDQRQSVGVPERTILATWILYSLIVVAIFQGTLTSTLVVPRFYPDIETMEDLIRVNLTVISSIEDWIILKRTYVNYTSYPLLNQIVLQKTLSLKKMLAMQGSNGFLVRAERARSFLSMARIRSDGRLRYKIMKEHPVPSAQAYVMPLDHPFSEEILWIVNKVHESGLYQHWRKHYFGWRTDLYNMAKINRKNDTHYVEKYIPLTSYHLQSAFFLLLMGLAVASVVYLVEFYWKRYTKVTGLQRKI